MEREKKQIYRGTDKERDVATKVKEREGGRSCVREEKKERESKR